MRCPHCDEVVDDASVTCPACNKNILPVSRRQPAPGRLDPTRALADLESQLRPPAQPRVSAPLATRVEEQKQQPSPVAKQLTAVLVLLSLLVAAQGWQIFRGMSVKAQGWEYIIDGPTDEQLQERLQTLGLAGWELVSARRTTTQRDGETKGIYEMIFRRPAGLLAVPNPPN